MVLIYCIEDINGLKYVGSTKQNMYKRFRQHYCDKKRGNNCTSKKLDLLNCEIYELEWCEESNRKERESYWINKLDCVNTYKLNSNNNLSARLYHHKNKEKQNKRRKKSHNYKSSWGGDNRHNNNLLEIDVKLFEY